MKKLTILMIMVCFLVPVLTAQQNNMVRIQGGTFTMGSPESEYGRGSDEVQHQVRISAFHMSRYPVAQREYQEIMSMNPSHFKGDNLPVECVTWFDAIEYCNKRSEWEGLNPAYTITGRRPTSGYPITAATVTWNREANGYRLPTEAEWEYACRAGTTTPFNTGNNITTKQVNYNGNYPYHNNAAGEYRETTTPVGAFQPNRWGLYDMHGNVWEWCWDWYGGYQLEVAEDPRGVVAGGYRVLRGGGWGNDGQLLRSACRSVGSPSSRLKSLGFRLVRL